MNKTVLKNSLAGVLLQMASLSVAVPVVAQTPPDNDNFVNAQILTGDGTWSGSNAGATSETNEPFHAAFGGASVWFQWTAQESGYLTVDTFGSNFDTLLAVYTGVAVDALTGVGADDNTFGPQSQVENIPIVAGETYSIAVDGYFAETGQIQLSWSYWDGTDITPPQGFSSSPLNGGTYVLNAVILAEYACLDEDLGSGVASCIGEVPVGAQVDTSTEGPHTFAISTTDLAGNSGVSTINYTVSGTDSMPPVVSIQSPVDGLAVAQGGLLIAQYTCVDETFGTGIASCVGNVPADTSVDTSGLGAFSFTVTGIDHAGNEAQETVNYNVVNSQPNDNFNNAIPLGQDGTLTGSNVGATRESGEPVHAFNQGGASVWYSWTATQSGYLTVDTFDSDFNTLLAVYEGESVNALTEVASNDNSGGFQSRITGVDVVAGATYAIVVDGWNGEGGNITLAWSWSDQFDTIPPTVTFWRPSEGQEIAQGETVFPGYSCVDPFPGAGLLLCEGSSPNGQIMDTSIPGEFVFTVTGTDNAANSTVISHNYTVIANPPNDNFVDAQILASSGSVSGTNAGATYESQEPNHGGISATTSVWFQFTPTVDGFLTADTVGSQFDTTLAIYSGSSVDGLTMLDSNDNTVGFTSEVKDVSLVAGISYSLAISGTFGEYGPYTLNWSYVELDDTTPPSIEIANPDEGALYFEGVSVTASYSCTDNVLGSGIASCSGDIASGTLLNTSVSGQFDFTVAGTDNAGNSNSQTVSYSVVPMSNDNFINALTLPELSGALVASNVDATKELGEPDHAGDTGGASVWFSWIAAEDGFFSVETFFSDFDTTLAVYTGTDVTTLTELASNDNALGSQSEIEDVPVILGQTYYIAVDGIEGAFGQINLVWSFFNGPDFSEITPASDPLWVTDEDHDFWLNAAAPADIDGDGDMDLAVIGFFVEYNVGAVDRLVVFLNEGPGTNGAWSFTTQEVPLNGLFAGGSDLAWGDFDNDGDPDLVVGSEGVTEMYRNDSGVLVGIDTDLPGYSEASGYSGAYNLRSLTWADYDNDADLDLLIPSVYDSANFAYTTKLMRNDGDDGAGGWLFTEVVTPIDGTDHAQTAWADNDGDGDLDMFIANADNFQNNGYVRLYENNNGAFSSSEPVGSLSIDYGLGDWSDYDGDGDLDILIVGLIQDLDGSYKTLLRIYENQAGNFVPNTLIQSSFFPWLDLFAATWADYDSDGDVDILVTGSTIGPDNLEGKSEVYVNEAGQFTPLGRDLPAPVSSSGRGGSFTWFDVDGDGDLDYFVAGAYFVINGNGLVEAQMHLYKNEAIDLNSRPQLATSTQVTVDGNDVNFDWDAATDDSTPVQSLTYELEIASQASGPGAATSRLPKPGGIQGTTNWVLQGMPDGDYHWTLRAVDSAFNGSVPMQGSFTIGAAVDTDLDGIADASDNCTLAANANQIDSDGDGFGNFCDPDFDNSGVVNFLDVGYFRNMFLSNDPHADMNGDGVVNFLDFPILTSLFLMPPGPSGIAP